MTRRKSLDLVQVDWVDIQSISGWHSRRDAAELEPLHCRDVGWVLFRNADRLVLVRSRQSDGGVGDITVIPAGCIRRVTQLEVVRAKRDEKPTPQTTDVP